MRHLDEAQAAVLVERDAAPGELHLQGHGMVLRPEQDGLALERRALFAMVQDAIAQPGRLLVFVATGDQDRPAAVLPAGPELFLAPLDGLGDDCIGGRQDGRGGTVVAREGEGLGAGKAPLEVEDVTHGGGAKTVDGLRVVADAGDAGAVWTQ